MLAITRNLQFDRFAQFQALQQFKSIRFQEFKVVLRPVPTVPPPPKFTFVQRGVRRGMSPWRKKAAGKGKEEEMKYTVPGYPVDSFCTPLYTSLHEIVDQ